jgi:hypothetical protein
LRPASPKDASKGLKIVVNAVSFVIFQPFIFTFVDPRFAVIQSTNSSPRISYTKPFQKLLGRAIAP